MSPANVRLFPYSESIGSDLKLRDLNYLMHRRRRHHGRLLVYGHARCLQY